MGRIFSHMTMSLDGYIARPDDQVGELFDWYEADDVTVPNPNENISLKVDEFGEHGHRQWAVGEHEVVERLEVERGAVSSSVSGSGSYDEKHGRARARIVPTRTSE